MNIEGPPVEFINEKRQSPRVRPPGTRKGRGMTHSVDPLAHRRSPLSEWGSFGLTQRSIALIISRHISTALCPRSSRAVRQAGG